jgi:probable regulatory domain-containing protein
MAVIINKFNPPDVEREDLEVMVHRVFFKTIDLLGGLLQLAEIRSLTWLASLARAAYAVVLHEEYLKTEQEIAQQLGLARNSVRNILRADPNVAMEKIKQLEESATGYEQQVLNTHIAGAISKLAYKMVKQGQEAQTLVEFCRYIAQESVKVCDSPWAYQVLKMTKGMRYPVMSAQQLTEKIKDVKINGVEFSEIAQKLSYPIPNPAILLKEIKDVLDFYK